MVQMSSSAVATHTEQGWQRSGTPRWGTRESPVVAALPAMIKIAEAMVDLRRTLGMTKSEAVMSRYSSTPPEVLQDLSSRGMGMPQVRSPRARDRGRPERDR